MKKNRGDRVIFNFGLKNGQEVLISTYLLILLIVL